MNLSGALAGGVVGLGVAMLLAGSYCPPPDLAKALARLDDDPGADAAQGTNNRRGLRDAREPQHRDGLDGEDRGGRLQRVVVALSGRLAEALDEAGQDLATSRLAQALRLPRLTADLSLLGETLEVLAVRKLGYLLLGLAFPPVLAAVLAAMGEALPWGLPPASALLLGGVLFMLPDQDVRIRARAARNGIRHAVCTYLELVALERAADAGPIEAIERAATVGDTSAFRRIRDTLTRAQLDGVPPWQGLSRLASDIEIDELGDLADIMATSGREGAAVYTSLRARAASLRTALTAQQTATANAASERMVVPVAALGLIFMAIVAYPAFIRITG